MIAGVWRFRCFVHSHKPMYYFWNDACICKTSKLLVLLVIWLPSWISSVHQRPTKLEVPLVESLSRKTGLAVGISSLCALDLEVCLLVIYPPPQSWPRMSQKPLPGEGLTQKHISNSAHATPLFPYLELIYAYWYTRAYQSLTAVILR